MLCLINRLLNKLACSVFEDSYRSKRAFYMSVNKIHLEFLIWVLLMIKN